MEEAGEVGDCREERGRRSFSSYMIHQHCSHLGRTRSGFRHPGKYFCISHLLRDIQDPERVLRVSLPNSRASDLPRGLLSRVYCTGLSDPRGWRQFKK
jgi:hypothetical protein